MVEYLFIIYVVLVCTVLLVVSLLLVIILGIIELSTGNIISRKSIAEDIKKEFEL